MKRKNSILSIFVGIVGIVGIAGGVLGLVSYIHSIMYPVPFASEKWKTVVKENIRTITISPLLSFNSIQGQTINREFELKNKEIIGPFWNEMQGEESRHKNGPGHWTSIKALKIQYALNDNTKIAFRITFSADYNIADYYMLETPESFYYTPSFASSPRGSGRLYAMLMELINTKGIKWVSDNPNYWRLEPTPEYIGGKR